MNEDDDKISASVVNDPHLQPSGISACQKRNIIRLLRCSRSSPTSMPAAPLQVDTNESGPEQQQLLNVSFKQQRDDANGKPIQTAKNNASDNTDVSPTSVCNMCCRQDEICVNLQNSHATVLTVSDITRLPSWDIRQILAAVCSRCLVYIGAITESSSKLRMRCEQAMHSQSVVLAPPTPDTSPNNFLQVTNTLLDDTADHSNNVQPQRNCYAPGYCDDTANEMSLPLATTSPPRPNLLTNQTFDAISRSPSPNNAGHDSMLRIHYERPVSPLNTESGGGGGGGGKNNKRSYQRVQVIPVQMICPHCNRAYWRKDYYRKHMRRCSAKFRYAKSVMPTRSRSASRLELDTMSLVSEGNERISSSQQQPRTFRCNICTVTVESIGKLRQHKRIHLPRFYCNICSGEYTSQNEYDFHRVECMAKKEVFEKGLEDIRNDVKSPELKPARRTTRSHSRALSVAPSVTPSKAETTTTKKVQAGKRGRGRPRKIQPEQTTTTPNDDGQSTITNYVKRHKHLYTSNVTDDDNNVALQQTNAVDKAEGDVEEDVEDDDEDDDVSEADTLYSKRLSFTNHWVEEHSISSHSHLSQGDNYIDEYMEDIPFRSLKEYDLYLLERLKIEVKLNSLTCFVPDCRFTCATLNEMMVHDYIYHYKKPWFYCYKCGYCFTSKVFLDYHLDLQNKGRYVCYKCGGHFEYQHQLDRHLIHHNRLSRNGGEKYVCHCCNFKFLDEDKLLKHCHYENHDWNARRHTIGIDHSMTISNKVPPPKNNKDRKRKIYKVKILNMALKPMPTKRCTPMEKYRLHLPPHLRIPNRIGQVEFRYPSNPNCVGCL